MNIVKTPANNSKNKKPPGRNAGGGPDASKAPQNTQESHQDHTRTHQNTPEHTRTHQNTSSITQKHSKLKTVTQNGFTKSILVSLGLSGSPFSLKPQQITLKRELRGTNRTGGPRVRSKHEITQIDATHLELTRTH